MMLGTKTSGKGAYFTALFPYVVLFTLFFFVITKDGAMDGVMLYFEPDWAKVMTIQVSKADIIALLREKLNFDYKRARFYFYSGLV